MGTLRVRLSKVHLMMSRTLSNQEVSLPSSTGTDPWQSEYDMMFFSNYSGRVVGDLHLDVELEAVSLSERSSSAEGITSSSSSGQQIVIEPLHQRFQTSADDHRLPLLAG